MTFVDFIEKATHLEVQFNLTDDVYMHFQRMSGDMNPLHTDADFAMRKGFPEKVMYGNILNGFVSYFVGMALPCPDVMIQAQDIKFRKPVYMNDKICIESEIEKISKVVECVIFKLMFYRTNTSEKQLVATGHVQIGMIHDK